MKPFVGAYSNSGMMAALSIRHEQPNLRKNRPVKYIKIQDGPNSGPFASSISAVRKQRRHCWNPSEHI